MHGPNSTYSFRNENVERSNVYKDTTRDDTADHAVTHLTLERSPNDGLERDGEFCKTTAGEHTWFGDVDYADDTDDVVVSGVGSLDIGVESVGQMFAIATIREDYLG